MNITGIIYIMVFMPGICCVEDAGITHLHADNGGNGHQHGKKTDMITENAQEWHVIPGNNGIIGGKVLCPQESFLPEFNGSGEEPEHGKQNGELQQHGKTSSHGTDTGFFVQGHGSLLFFHFLALGIFMGQLIHLGFQYLHPGL